MMRATRRGVMAGGVVGALAVPTVAGLASWRWAYGEGSVLLHDPSLEAGRRFAEAGRAAGGRVLALEGDPIRLAQSILGNKPALIAGISRHADALLVEEAAGEAGYVRVAAFEGLSERCAITDCLSGWHPLSRMVENAGPGWIEALASFAASVGRRVEALPATPSGLADPGRQFGWMLAPR